MTFDFSERYFGQSFLNKLQHVYPFVKFRVREGITIKSKHCALDELGTFIIDVENQRIAPKFSGAVTEGTEVNLLPLLCVGMIEFLLDQTTNVMLDFEEILFQRLSTEVIEHDIISEYLSECDIAKCTDVVKLAYSLRYGQTTLGKKHSLQTLGYLHFVAFKLPKLFAEIFFDFMYVYMATMRIYCDKDAKVVGYDEETNVKEYGRSKVSLDYKYYTMKTPRKNTIKLSNCRGLGLACLNLLGLYVIKDTDRNFTIFKDSFITSAEANFFAGLGDDITARLISGKSVLTANAERSYTEYVIFNSNRTYSIGDKSICREVYEEEFLYRKAHGVSYNEGLGDTEYKDVSVHYYTIDSFISASSVIYTICAKNESSYRENIRLLKCAKSELEKSKRQISSLETELKKASSEKDKLVEKLTEEYNEKFKELNYQLEQKSQINAQLSEKITSLNSKLSSFFCEEDLDASDDEVVIEVSQEERTNYLNGFSFLMLGGREGLAQKLEDTGWTSVTQIFNSNNPVLSSDASSRPNIDFIIICTKFVSHNLVRSMESKFSDLTDRIIYFNGTNVDYLTRVTVDFIKKYMED